MEGRASIQPGWKRTKCSIKVQGKLCIPVIAAGCKLDEVDFGREFIMFLMWHSLRGDKNRA